MCVYSVWIHMQTLMKYRFTTNAKTYSLALPNICEYVEKIEQFFYTLELIVTCRNNFPLNYIFGFRVFGPRYHIPN